MMDPDAAMTRRTWVACPCCPSGSECAACREQRTCEEHWRYLLAAEGRRLWVQCPACRHRWWHDTGFGARARAVPAPPEWPRRAA